MSILRLPTLSLTLATAVFALGYVSPSFANPPPHSHGGGNNGGDPVTYTVNLKGPDPNTPSLRGAFEFVSSVAATLDKKGNLKGDVDVSMEIPGGDSTCMSGDQNACIVWNNVFDLCGLLNPVPNFMVLGGDWSVSKGGGRRWISFGFELDSPVSSNPLSASLQLSSACDDPECGAPSDELIPAAGDTSQVDVTDYAIHLKGKGGVTHNAECHASDGYPGATTLGGVHGSTLVITAPE